MAFAGKAATFTGKDGAFAGRKTDLGAALAGGVRRLQELP